MKGRKKERYVILKSGIRGKKKSLTFPDRTFLGFLDTKTHVRPLGWVGWDSKGDSHSLQQFFKDKRR